MLLLAAVLQIAAYFIIILKSTVFQQIARDLIFICIDVLVILALLKVNFALKLLFMNCKLLLNR